MSNTQTFSLQAAFNLHAERYVSWVSDEYLYKHYNTDLEDIIKSIEKADLSYLHINDQEIKKRPHVLTSLYVYNKKNLQKLLDKNKNILVEAKWPTDANKFIYYMSYVHAPANSAIFDLIYKCFDDQTDNPWLRKNCQITGKHRIKKQRSLSNKSKTAFKALHPNW